MTEQFTFFWNGPFSQWHPSVFTVNGLTEQFNQPADKMKFTHAEQFMMYSKAMFFDDEVTATKIMKTNKPSEQKVYGRLVTPFDKIAWETVARTFVKIGSIAKFSQNPNLMKKLLATTGTTLVEASPYDKIWGIGLRAKDPRALNRETWLGTNWLGEVLTEVRDDFL